MTGLITVKDCISAAAMEIGITQKPVNTVVNSSDQDVVQMLALLSAVADEVLLEEPYRVTLGDGIWIAGTNSRPQTEPLTDNDLIMFDRRLAINGLKYRFLKAKGLEYGEEMRDFLTRMAKLSGRVNGRVLDLDLEGGRAV